jgi:hypothetical protein
MRWAGSIERMGEKKNAYRLLVGKPECKRLLGNSRRRCVDNIKMDLLYMVYDDINLVDAVQDRDQ